MFRSFLVLYICCVLLSVAQITTEDNPVDNRFNEKPPECGPNEVLNDCVGCPYEDSCYDRNQIICPAPFVPCLARCVCKEGFIRKTLFTECIPKEECGAPCDLFETYTECKECSNETCSSIANPVNCESEKPKKCTPGCICWDGYYRENATQLCLDRCICPEIEGSPDCESWNLS